MKRRDFAIGLGAGSLAALAGAPRAGRAEIGPLKTVVAPPTMGWIAGEPKGDIAVAQRAWTWAQSPATTLGRSDALLIAQDGKLVFERYGPEHGPDVRHISWSMAKSITHALAGIAVNTGQVDIDAPLKTVAHADPKLTLRALLTLTDGLGWDEGSYKPTDSDAARMLYGAGRLDGASYTALKRQAFPPGTRWNYSTGSFQLAAAELQSRLFPNAIDPHARRAAMAEWMQASLFGPLGMTSALAEFDAAGTFAGGSLVYATARDFARFGEFYRQDGVWAGRRMLPDGWVKFARTPTVQKVYGAGFWLEAPAGHNPPSMMGGHGPLDAYSCPGHAGQVVLVVPSKKLVVTRLALMPDDDPAWVRLGAWLAPIVNAFPDG
jgi:CubicO group peptidase (beta-lactamase class C family)